MKIELNGQDHPLFLNSNTDSFCELKDKKIAVVGSSGILLNSEYGELIDTHDIVVRFNASRVKGFEKHVGSQTDIRFFNGHAFAGSSDSSRFKKHDPNFVSSLSGETFIVKSWNMEEFAQGILKNTPQNSTYFLNPTFTRYCNSITGQEATCGIVGIFFLSLFTTNLSCFGFNFYKDGWSKNHYWEEIQEYNQGHSFNNEETIFKQLEEENKLKTYR